MKKLFVLGIIAVMVMGMAVSAMAADFVDNAWNVFIRPSTDAAAKTGAGTAVFGLKTATGDSFSNLTAIANLGASPEINYTNDGHPYTSDYNVVAGRTFVAKLGGSPLGTEKEKKQTIDWMFRAAGVAGATVYVTAWNQTGANNLIDAGIQQISLYESNADGDKIGNAVWSFMPGVTTTWAASTGIAGEAGTNFWQKSYTLGAADDAGGAYQYFVLEATVPEPGSMVALMSGLVGLVGFGIRRKK